MNQLRCSLVACGLVLVAGASGCRKQDPAPRGEAEPDGGVGVPVCDGFLLEYERCILRAPSPQREVLRERVGTLRQAWKTAAQQVERRGDLPRICQAARVTARRTLAALKCRW